MFEMKFGVCIYIYMSSEMAVSDKFKEVLDDMIFRSKLCMVAIDEVYLVYYWG